MCVCVCYSKKKQLQTSGNGFAGGKWIPPTSINWFDNGFGPLYE